MSGTTLRQTVLVTNPQGFHMRPAAAFAKLAMTYRCDVHVLKEDLRVDGKSTLNLLTMFAPAGTELIIEVTGEDAGTALPALVDVINTSFDE
jgi:phosphotransferase system HPr (HPr) family protein